MDRKQEGGSIPMVKWLKVVIPKYLGGWCLKNLEVFAQALKAWSLWRILHNLVLWERLIRSKYLPIQNFVE